MEDKEPQDHGQKGKKSSKFKSFEPHTRIYQVHTSFHPIIAIHESSSKESELIRTQDRLESGPSNFEFIEVTEPQTAASSSSTTKAVRSYVMRKFHQEKQSGASGKRKAKFLARSSSTSDNTVAQGGLSLPPVQIEDLQFPVLEEDNEDIPAQGHLQLMGVRRALSAEMEANRCSSTAGSVMVVEPVPPLVTKFPVPEDAMKHVHFALTMINKYSAPMALNDQSGGFSVVTSNIACFHATVLISIATQAQIRRIPLPPECFYHSSEAARHVNDSLRDPKTACAEENINAIATLVMFESFVTQKTKRSVHLVGLEMVLRLRKERNEPALDDNLKDYVLCVDQHVAASNNTPTRLSIQPSTPAPLTTTDFQSWALTTPSLPPLPQTTFPFLSPPNNILYHRVRQFSLITSQLYVPRFEVALQREYIKGLLLLQQQLYSTTLALPCETLWYHTTVLFTFLILRKIPFGSAATAKMVVRMRQAVLDLGKDTIWECGVEKGLLLWVCMMGGVASVGREEIYEWWVGLLRKLREEMGLEGWEEARGVLRGFAWVEYMCESVCRLFWQGAIEGPRDEVEEEVAGKGKGKDVANW